MKIKRIPLDEQDTQVYLDAYIADETANYTRSAILVIPGGGYRQVCSDREGEPIALAFIALGYNAFVLHYSVASTNKKVYPSQLIEASKAIKHIKDNSNEYGIDPERVFACGFSAGGHLTGSLGIMWHRKEIYDVIDMPYGYNKPAGVMLIYPVTTVASHPASFENLLGKAYLPSDEFDYCDLEKNVDKRSVPAYMLHTVNDPIVDVRGTLALAKAYTDNDIPFELHIYPDAPHGVALGNEITEGNCKKWNNPAIGKWIENAVYWAKNINSYGVKYE